jgi:hypothetical protein
MATAGERSEVWNGFSCGVSVILLVFGRGGGACEAGGGGALRLSRSEGDVAAAGT